MKLSLNEEECKNDFREETSIQIFEYTVNWNKKLRIISKGFLSTIYFFAPSLYSYLPVCLGEREKREIS